MVVNLITQLKVFITDLASGVSAKVTSDGFLQTTCAPVVPSGKTAVSDIVAASVAASTTTNTTYVIPAGKTLTIQQFDAGGQGYQYTSKIALYYAPNGTLDGAQTLICASYCTGKTFSKNLNYVCQGTAGTAKAAIIMSRRRMDANAGEVYGGWWGYIN